MNNCLSGFNSERIDPVSGHYHPGNGYRAYSPVLMRFTCPDNMSPFNAGGINPYAYCAGDPVNHSDPTGHLSWQAWLGIGMGIVGLGLAVFTAGASIAAAGGIIAAIESASAVSLAVGAAGVVSDVAAIASGATEDINPQASAILGWVSLGTGAVGLAKGMYRAARIGYRRLNKLASAFSKGLSPVGEDVARSARNLKDGEINTINKSSEIGRGGSAVLFDQGDGYLIKEFHEPVLDEALQQNEVNIFNMVYGHGSARIIDNQKILMRKINGTPISEIDRSIFTKEDVNNLFGKVQSLHDMKVFHGDLNYGNVLFEEGGREFHLIDFGSSRMNSTEYDLTQEMVEFKNGVKQWPVFQSPNNIPSIIDANGRFFI